MHARMYIVFACIFAVLVVVIVSEQSDDPTEPLSTQSKPLGDEEFYAAGERNQLRKELEAYFAHDSRIVAQPDGLSEDKKIEVVDGSMENAAGQYSDEPELLARHAESIALRNNGSFAGEPFELLSRSLDIDSTHKPSLWLMALANQQMGNHDAAVIVFEMLKRQLSPSDDSIKTIDAAIAASMSQVESQSVADPEPIPATAPDGADSALSKNPEINLYITLVPEILNTFSPDDTVYIYAQASDGTAMPLAVTRRRIADFPAEVTLDDSMSMMPSLSLSSSDLVTVGARASRSGTAMPMAGDWEVKLYKVPVSTTEVIPLNIQYELK